MGMINSNKLAIGPINMTKSFEVGVSVWMKTNITNQSVIKFNIYDIFIIRLMLEGSIFHSMCLIGLTKGFPFYVFYMDRSAAETSRTL